jgi:hypothetical protein
MGREEREIDFLTLPGGAPRIWQTFADIALVDGDHCSVSQIIDGGFLLATEACCRLPKRATVA